MPDSQVLKNLAVSQKLAVNFFEQVLRSGRLSHAYLLKGQPVLAAPLITALAQTLFCEAGGCGHCVICHAVASETWPDLHYVRTAPEAKSPILKLAQIKKLIEQVTLPPTQSKQQIFVIEHAENMNAESGNALLKTLEEPVSSSLLILVSPYPARVLPTLRSRSQQVALHVSPETALTDEMAELWRWDQLEAVTTVEGQLALYKYLESLSRPILILQLQLLQKECWQRLRQYLQKKPSKAVLQRAQTYLSLFEQALETLSVYGNTKLALEFFCQDFVQLRRQQTERQKTTPRR
jgi:DNA polymerase III delta prime subunit